MTTILDWWSLSVAKVGLPATIALAVYLTVVVLWLADVVIGLAQFLRYRVRVRRRLADLHRRPGSARVLTLRERVARRRSEWGGPDAAA